MNSIRTNIPGLTAQRVNALNNLSLSKSLEKLSTSLKINRGADDPAGLISSENLKAALVALEAESRVIQRVDQVANVAEGALDEVSSLLNEAKGLAVANANTGAMSDSERAANQAQIDSILSSVDRISRTTNFNGQNLLDGTATFTAAGGTLNIDSVATTDIGNIDIKGQLYTLSDVGSAGPLNTITGNVAGASESIDAAINQVASLRGKIGSFQKHTLNARLNSINVTIENTAAANSQIRDTDYAAQTSRLARDRVLSLSSLRAIGLTQASATNTLTLLD
jgi:flagellin-like hook-associated protein FlgL